MQQRMHSGSAQHAQQAPPAHLVVQAVGPGLHRLELAGQLNQGLGAGEGRMVFQQVRGWQMSAEAKVDGRLAATSASESANAADVRPSQPCAARGGMERWRSSSRQQQYHGCLRTVCCITQKNDTP